MPKVKTVKMKSGNFPEMMSLFNEIMNMDATTRNIENFPIILEKYKEYQDYIHRFLELSLLFNSSIISNGCIVVGLREFIDKLVVMSKRHLQHNTAKFDKLLDPKTGPTKDIKEITDSYFELLESDLIVYIVTLGCNALKAKVHKYTAEEYFSRLSDLSTDILDGIAIDYNPKYKELVETLVNIQFIEEYFKLHQDTETFDTLLKMIELGKKVRETQVKPDINTEQIFDILSNVLNQFKSNIRGCTKGFDIILQKKDLFQKNFKEYYKSMIESGSPTAFITDFVDDIIKEAGEGDGTYSTGDINQVKKIGLSLRKDFASRLKNVQAKMPEKHKGVVTKLEKVIDGFMGLLEKEEMDVDEASDLLKNFNIKI